MFASVSYIRQFSGILSFYCTIRLFNGQSVRVLRLGVNRQVAKEVHSLHDCRRIVFTYEKLVRQLSKTSKGCGFRLQQYFQTPHHPLGHYCCFVPPRKFGRFVFSAPLSC
jgi:hypothetical protein